MPGLDPAQIAELQLTWEEAHLAASRVVTLQVHFSSGEDDTYGDPTGVTYAGTDIHAQVFWGDNRRYRSVFGDDVDYTAVAELSRRELTAAGLVPKETDRVDFDGKRYLIAAIRGFEPIEDEHLGLALALRYEEDA